MALWTDVIDPADLTGYARESLIAYEADRGSLSAFLPDRPVNDTVARFVQGANGLVDVAEYRAYDAETSIGDSLNGQRVTVELPPLGRKYHNSEYDQLRLVGRQGDDALVQSTADRLAAQAARAVSDRLERMRGVVLETGKATVNENGFIAEADFGRDEKLNVTLNKKWTESDASPVDDIRAWADLYADTNGVEPGALVMSNKAISLLARSEAVRSLAGFGGATPGVLSVDQLNLILQSHELPAIQRYNRRVQVAGKTERVIGEDTVLLLPAAADDWQGTELGATFWGTTLESVDPRYSIPFADQPGLVVGAYREDDPLTVWVRSAAIALPVLANANLSMAIKVA